MKDLKGQIVLITGGGSGLGRLMSFEFVKLGSTVVLVDLHVDSANKVAEECVALAKELGIAANVHAFQCDVSDRDTIYRICKEIKEKIGKVDVLVNNAGIVTGKPFFECKDEMIKKTMAVNVEAHFWLVKALVPDMIAANHGHLVTIASAAGWAGVNGLADYCASKYAAVGFDESIRLELRKKRVTGVKTTCVCPFYINTGMFQGVKTRFPLLLPILEPEYVVSKIMSAIQNDQALLMTPRLLYLTPMLRTLLPVSLFDWAADFLGVTSSMDEFKGRGEKFYEAEPDAKKRKVN